MGGQTYKKEKKIMMHELSEIYVIYNSVNRKEARATKAYVEAYAIPVPNFRDRNKHLVYARPMSSHVNANKPLTVRDIDDKIKLIYLFGEKTWFDSQEELDAYRAEYHKERNAMIAKNKLIKAVTEKLQEMSAEEIAKILETL